MSKFITAFLSAIVFAGAAQADLFSNEDAACTGICQVHDNATTDKKRIVRKEAAPAATASRHAKGDASVARRRSAANQLPLS